MPDFETLLWEVSDGVATVTLNRPAKRNAMSWRMFEEIEVAFGAAEADPAIRALVVTGAGGAFCSGADLSDPANAVSSAAELGDRMRRVNAIAAAVATCPVPTVAAVPGVAAGAGCNLALLCDLVVASEDATFAELFVRRGLAVDFGGTWALTRSLPLARAKELALLGEPLDARGALELGLVNRVCPPGELLAVAADLAGRLAALPPRTVGVIKATLNRSAERSLEECLEAEGAAQALMFATEDTHEAIRAWLERRPPRFTGR